MGCAGTRSKLGEHAKGNRDEIGVAVTLVAMQRCHEGGRTQQLEFRGATGGGGKGTRHAATGGSGVWCGFTMSQLQPQPQAQTRDRSTDALAREELTAEGLM